ncbi:MAG TPA: hypothetical protein VNB94_08835, partial [Mycobacteriales bacterium]|nr:hypothetical protein [Mycobacteriales bacterium]
TVDESVLSSPVTPGRFPIAAWGLHAPGEFGAALSRAAAALRAFPHVENQVAIGARTALESLGETFRTARGVITPCEWGELRPFLSRLATA